MRRCGLATALAIAVRIAIDRRARASTGG